MTPNEPKFRIINIFLVKQSLLSGRYAVPPPEERIYATPQRPTLTI